jgi:4-amino-4-deoxy-L-arabinose transferase-like glycosyltransferase
MRANKLLYLLCFVLLFGIMLVRDYTPANELKYISIAGEAIEDGTFFTFYNHGEAYADKPPLFFWLIMGVMKATGGGFPMWLIGLFSLLPAIGIMMVMDRWMLLARKKYSQATANLMLLTTLFFLAGTLVVRMDMLMSFFIVLSLYTFYKLYKEQAKRRDRWLLPVWIFLAIFSKGPMGFIIPLLSMAAFLLVKRDLRRFGRYMGWGQWGILLGLCTVWFSMIYVEGGAEYLDNLLFKQTVGRGIDSFHHKEPVWFYLPRIFWSFAPWILLYLVAIFKGAGKRLLGGDMEKMMLTVIVANFIMLSLVSSKIDIYMLPIYPFVTYLAADLLSRYRTGKAEKVAVGIPAVLFMLMLPASFFFTDKIPLELGGSPWVIILLSILCLGGILSMVFLLRSKLTTSIISLALGLCGVIFFAPPVIKSNVNEYIGIGPLADAGMQMAEHVGGAGYATYWHDGFKNMDVYLGESLRKLDDVAALAEADAQQGYSVVFVRNKDVRNDEQLRNWLDGIDTFQIVGNNRAYLLGGRE